jgi:hypothetical protein
MSVTVSSQVAEAKLILAWQEGADRLRLLVAEVLPDGFRGGCLLPSRLHG